MSSHEPLTVIGPIAIAIPLFVTLVVCLVARREGTALPRAAMGRLAIGTVAAIVAWRFFDHPGVMIGLTAALFLLLAIPVMQSLEKSATQRLSSEPVRSADLVPRSIGTYVPLWLRGAEIVAGLVLLCWVVARATATRPQLMMFGFTFAAITFFGLYESWIRQEVFSVRAASDADRRARVRAIFVAQVILTLSFLLMAGLSAGAWPGLVPLGATAVIIGGTGCAFALSTGIQERYLQAWSARR